MSGLMRLGIIRFLILGLAAVCMTGTALTRESAEMEDENLSSANDTQQPMSAAQLQRLIMDFSDRYISALWLALDHYIQNEPDISKQVKAQRWKVMLGSTAMTIAASRDPRSGLLDMAVFISAGKWAAHRYWIPEVFGPGAEGLRTVYSEMDREIWADVARVLTPAQQADLRRLIRDWTATNPSRVEVLDVRLRNLDGVVLKNFSETSSARGLLASVRRLLGSVDQSLLYGERVIFYMERMPRILTLQSDLTIDRVAERFPIATVNPDFSGLADFSKDFPDKIEHLIASRENFVRETMPELRASVESFERTSASLQQSLASVQALSEKMEQLPFQQEDYAVAYERVAHSLQQTQEVVDGLNRLVDTAIASEGGLKAVGLVQKLDQKAHEWINAVFYRALLLIASLVAGGLILLIAARVLFRPARQG